jgi:lipid A 3-O-deacylase
MHNDGRFPFLRLCGTARRCDITAQLDAVTLDPMKPRHLLTLAAALFSIESSAAGLSPDGWFLQAGAAAHSTYTAGAGVVWRWDWHRDIGGGVASGSTEAFVSHWSARRDGQQFGLTQLGVLPLLRYRPDQGRSPWFVEAGIGLTVMDRIYRTNDKEFSTRFNFADVLAVGRSFGPQGRHELSLRLTHFSNGGIKHPNPGENLVRVHYAVMF